MHDVYAGTRSASQSSDPADQPLGADEGPVWRALGFRELDAHVWGAAGFSPQQADFVRSVAVLDGGQMWDGGRSAVTWMTSGLPPWWVVLCMAAGVHGPSESAALLRDVDDQTVASLVLRSRGRGLDPWRMTSVRVVAGPGRRLWWTLQARWLEVVASWRR